MTYFRTAMIALSFAAALARFLLTFAALFGFLAGGSWLLVKVLGWGWPWWTYGPLAALQALWIAYKVQFDANGSEQPTPDQAGDLDEDFMKLIGPYLTPVLAEAGLTGASAEDIRSMLMLRVSHEASEIIGDYGGTLEALNQEGYGHLYPLSRLPYPKSVVRDAMDEATAKTPKGKFAEAIEGGLACLDRFVPDEEIPDPLDRSEDYFERVLDALRREYARTR